MLYKHGINFWTARKWNNFEQSVNVRVLAVWFSETLFTVEQLLLYDVDRGFFDIWKRVVSYVVIIHKTVRRHISEKFYLHIYRCEILRSHDDRLYLSVDR